VSGRRVVGAVLLTVVLATSALTAQDRSRYRDFVLGADVASVAAIIGVPASQAVVVHERPALMQEFRWQRPYTSADLAGASRDPVRQIVFSFYDSQLSRMVVDYDHDRTVGMTDADLIDAISVEYGSPSKPSAKGGRSAASQLEPESGTAIAHWTDTDCAVVLYRSPFGDGFRLIVTSPKLDGLAQVAEARALMLDQRDAPARELARQKKEAADALALQDQSRTTNKAAFRP
jgi:hypothetical protein